MIKLQIGCVFKIKYNNIYIIVPYHFFSSKYKKLQVKIKKYLIKNYKKEYTKGDFVLFNPKNNKIYNIMV